MPVSISSVCNPGAFVCGFWIPPEVWVRLAHFIHGIPAQHVFINICRAAACGVEEARARSLALRCDSFRLKAYLLPDGLADRVLMVQPVPGGGKGLVLFIDEAEMGSGIEIAWLCNGAMKTATLGLDNIPASAVSNIRFAPDANSIAMLVTLGHGAMLAHELDPLRRLRGWPGGRALVEFSPCEDCTVQVVDFQSHRNSSPGDLVVHTFSHVFVPEYGFDMVWRHQGEQQELAFAAMLHSEEGAATYLVRWRDFRNSDTPNFIFMACIDGACQEMPSDKRDAILKCPRTICTSRIEIGDDARHIFFDTMSKFGILRFDQVEDSSHAKVTRADLVNSPISPLLRMTQEPQSSSTKDENIRAKDVQAGTSNSKKHSSSYNSITGNAEAPKMLNNVTRISRMSPDGTLLCSVVDTFRPIRRQTKGNGTKLKYVEMRSSATGCLLYRRVVLRRPDPGCLNPTELPLEKSGDIAHNTISFSDDSSMVMVWDSFLTKAACQVLQKLPLVLESRTGGIVQDFEEVNPPLRFESMQMSPDGEIIYGTRMEDDRIVMDAVDVLTGTVLKTVDVTGRVHRPPKFSAHSVYLLPNGYIHTVARGRLDVLWESSRGSAGCGWEHLKSSEVRPDDEL